MSTKIKICGLFRDCDIDYVNRYKPDYIGFVFWEKSHRYVSTKRALELKSRLDKDIKAVGVFVDEALDVIADIADKGMIDLIQLHGRESDEEAARLKEMTSLQVIRAVRPEDFDKLRQLDESCADYLLLDSGMGSGRPFDWSSDIKRPVKPFFIAGGINAANLKEAVQIFEPYAVDISSGVESGREKDPEKIKRVIEIIREESVR